MEKRSKNKTKEKGKKKEKKGKRKQNIIETGRNGFKSSILL